MRYKQNKTRIWTKEKRLIMNKIVDLLNHDITKYDLMEWFLESIKGEKSEN